MSLSASIPFTSGLSKVRVAALKVESADKVPSTAVTSKVLLLFAKASTLTFIPLLLPPVAETLIISPSTKPSFTKSRLVIIVEVVVVNETEEIVFKDVAETTKFIELARASIVSLIAPTLNNLPAKYVCAPLKFPSVFFDPSLNTIS